MKRKTTKYRYSLKDFITHYEGMILAINGRTKQFFGGAREGKKSWRPIPGDVEVPYIILEGVRDVLDYVRR